MLMCYKRKKKKTSLACTISATTPSSWLTQAWTEPWIYSAAASPSPCYQGVRLGFVRTGGLLYVRGKNSAISADYVPTRSFRVTSLLSGGTEIQRGPLTAAHLVQGLTRSDVEGDLMLIAAMLLRTMWISSYT